MNKKNAFTLIELLAVIIILAVIALISVPIVLNIIESARKSAFKDSTYGLLESAKLEYIESLMSGRTEIKVYEYPFEDLEFSGSKPKGGVIRIDEQGNVEVAIHNNRWCAKKTKEDTKVNLIQYEKTTCMLTEVVEPPKIEEKTFTEVMSNSNEVASLDPDHNLRYVGSDPNNYVKFNNELWRIIGVFEGSTKIIRDEPYSTSIAWDKNASNGGHGGYGYNDWSQATLQVELNTTFLGSIDSTSKSLINQNYTWKLGGWNTTAITRSVVYEKERGTTVYSGRPKTWIGAIGLMYPSDYAYATSSTEEYCNTANLISWNSSSYADCKNRNWLYDRSNHQWTITPNSNAVSYVFDAHRGGSVGWYHASNTFAVKPVLYLKSTVKIKSGEGTKINPFTLGTQ